MLKKGLNVFKSRESNIEFDNNLIPSSFGYFIKCFNVGNNLLNVDFIKKNNDLIQLTCINYKSVINGKMYENTIAYLYNLQELNEELSKYIEVKEDYHKLGFIKIGYFDISDGLLLKITGNNSGEIWKLNGDWGEPLPYVQRLSKDIFDFSLNLQEVLIELNLIINNINIKDIVRNFDSDYWLVNVNH